MDAVRTTGRTRVVLHRMVVTVLMLSLLTVFAAFTPAVATQNVTMPGSNFRLKDGSNYWGTSNLREWLNSDADVVGYTNQAPDVSSLGANAYADERGFLTNFSPQEQASIAVTKRKSNVTAADGPYKDGGTMGTPWYDGAQTPILNYFYTNMEANWGKYNHRLINDKVFNLSPIEMFTYVQKRGLKDNMRKSPTDAMKSRENITSAYVAYWGDYVLQTSNEWKHLVEFDGSARLTIPRLSHGVAPAMHVKPDTVFRDGSTASTTQIGSVVKFGSYDGEPLSWLVVNRTPNGHVLLWSEKVIDNKPFDAPGDASLRDSEHLDFTEVGVDLTNSLYEYSVSGDTVAPEIIMENPDDLTGKRQNESWVIQVRATDAAGIRHIITPDGKKTAGGSVNYTVTKNDVFVFTAVDNNGNHGYLNVPVGNVNEPANVMITSSSDGWTNKNVTVDISASNRIDPVVWRGTSSFRTAGGSPFPSRLSYAGKKMRITGTVEMVDAKADPSNYLTRIGMQMRTLRPAAGTNGWHYAMTYPAPDSIPLQDINGKQVSFDFTQTVPTDYYSNLGVIVFNNSLGGENALSANHFTLKWDIKYELLDQDDFKVEKIVLPTGKEVLSDRYTDTLTSDGTYTYKVHDSRGKITERSVSVKIDKVAPSLNLSASTTATTHSNIVLTARGADALSGVKRIQLPNNEWVDAATATYNVGTNGTYTFMVEDNAGNTLSRSVTVSNIDKSVSITSPTVGSFGSTVLTDSAQELFTTVSLITVKDWSEGANYWRLEASATRMSTAAGDMLPVGSLSVAPLSSVSKAAGGSGGTPSVVANGWQVMDGSSPARLAVSNGSRGEHTAVFPTKALKLTLDPATARHGTYSATVRWELVRAP